MKKQIIVILIVATLAFLAVVVWQQNGLGSNLGDNSQVAPTEDPMDITMELYGPWLDGLQATSTEFNKITTLDAAPLTADLRVRLVQQLEASQAGVDPVLCQVEPPERIGTKSVFVNEGQSQVIVVPRGSDVPEQALVTLVAIDGQWIISDIACSRGELAPELEYTFDQSGNLLKQSLQPPLNNDQWHLIYTRDGVDGNAIPLLFDATSVCLMPDGSEQVCEPDQLTEAAAVQLQGAMQEAGVLVERMQLQ